MKAEGGMKRVLAPLTGKHFRVDFDVERKSHNCWLFGKAWLLQTRNSFECGSPAKITLSNGRNQSRFG
jgi:hypothetical protein